MSGKVTAERGGEWGGGGGGQHPHTQSALSLFAKKTRSIHKNFILKMIEGGGSTTTLD